MKSYQQAPSAESKKSGRKREGSPYDPYKRKARGKETRPGSCQNPSKTAQTRACACGGACKAASSSSGASATLRVAPPSLGLAVFPAPRRTRRKTRYEIAGAGAEELIKILGGKRERDRRTWAYYCYHHDIEILLDKAYEIASRRRQGEIRNPVTAFQRWLKRSFGREAV